MATAPSAGQTEALNGVRIYFETHGTGEPLLLLHGFSGSSQDWLSSTPAWVQTSSSSCPDMAVQHFAEAVPASRRGRHIGTARPPENWRL